MRKGRDSQVPGVKPQRVGTKNLTPEHPPSREVEGAPGRGVGMGVGSSPGSGGGSSKPPTPASGLKARAHLLPPPPAGCAPAHRFALTGHALASAAPAHTPPKHTRTRALAHASLCAAPPTCRGAAARAGLARRERRGHGNPGCTGLRLGPGIPLGLAWGGGSSSDSPTAAPPAPRPPPIWGQRRGLQRGGRARVAAQANWRHAAGRSGWEVAAEFPLGGRRGPRGQRGSARPDPSRLDQAPAPPPSLPPSLALSAVEYLPEPPRAEPRSARGLCARPAEGLQAGRALGCIWYRQPCKAQSRGLEKEEIEGASAQLFPISKVRDEMGNLEPREAHAGRPLSAAESWPQARI